MNLTGLDKRSLRAAAEWSASPARQAAALGEILRRELAGETEQRIGRRKMGNDGGVAHGS